MLKSYLTTALRHLVGQRLYSAINLLGLSVGLACFVLIALFVEHELGYDRHFANADRIYRVSRDFLRTEISTEAFLATMAPNAAALLEDDFPEIEETARLSCCGGVVGTPDNRVVHEPGLASADNELFAIFDFEWLAGDPATALTEPFTMVLTRSLAAKHFGAENPLGQTLLLQNRWPVRVSGVIEDLPPETHLGFSALVSLETTRAIDGADQLDDWSFNAYHTYVLLREGATADAIRADAGEFFERNFETGSGAWTRLVVTPLTDIHLHSRRAYEMRVPGNAAAVYALAAVAAFVLLLACINFMNLATARAGQRAKEIAVRKTIGAGRRQIVAQFLAESVLLALIALVVALMLVELALPAFNVFVDKELTLDYFDGRAMAALSALAVLTGLLAGSYPALYLSAFDPAAVLQGNVTRGRGAAAFRKALVVAQFAISIVLLIATGVVYQQTRFARNLELGYETERVLIVTGSFYDGVGDQWETLKRAWLAHPEITHVTASNLVPSEENASAVGVRVEGGDLRGGGVPFLWVDYGFFETYGIDVLAGRTFGEEYGADRPAAAGESARDGSFVISELAATTYGWSPEEAIGKWLEITAVDPPTRGTVVGVVEDVYLESVRNPIDRVVYLIAPERDALDYHPLRNASLKLTGRDFAATLAYVDEKWRELVPDQPISRRFLDDDFDALYREDERQGQLLMVAAALAVVIAVLGLFGLASFATERRTKEIGIRKVVGGTVLDIVRLFTGEFGRLVLIANLVAWPVAYLAMREWLSGFAYRIELGPLVFLGSALVALAVALATVGAVAARAAAAKPIQSLRYE